MATREEIIAAIRNADKAGDSASVRKLGAYLQTMSAAPEPVIDERSTLDNVAAGAGAKLTDLALGAKQRFQEVAAAMEGNGEHPLRKLMGIKPAAQELADTQQQVKEKRATDAPLMATTGGKIGAIAGVAVPAVVASMVPGGQTLAGSMLTGAALGGAEPTVEGESALKNAAIGGGSGAAGYGVGKVLAAGATKLAANQAAARGANAVKDAAAADAKAAGYIIPPTQSNPTLANRALEGLAGKISTGQAASVKNQTVTNAMTRRALGLPEDAPLTIDTLKAVRQQAGQAYSAVKSAGQMNADAQFTADLLNITSGAKNASQNFPGLVKSEIDDVVAALNQKQFDAGGAVDAIRILRDKADTAFSGGDKSLGKAYRAASDALEGVIERNLSQSGNPQALTAFQQARQLIAKTYSVEKALNQSTGNVSAPKLGAQLAKQKPLSGELESVAKFGQAFPKAAQEITTSIPGVSPLDFMGAAGLSAATANPLMMATAAARPIARSVILSKPYQNMAGSPTYRSIADLMVGGKAQEAARIGALVSPQLAQQK